MNFIEELFYGNINPNEKCFARDTQYAKAADTLCNCEKILTETLEGDTLKIFNRLMNANDEITACISVENFKIGFILATQLMTDCFKTDATTIFKDI